MSGRLKSLLSDLRPIGSLNASKRAVAHVLSRLEERLDERATAFLRRSFQDKSLAELQALAALPTDAAVLAIRRESLGLPPFEE